LGGGQEFLTIAANNPKPNNVPAIGMSQKTGAPALHPYQNKPTHMNGEKYTIGSKRNSGISLSPAATFL